ncbi:hypothetical protein ACLOJK_023505 [Asimina triloba]
MSLVQVLKQRPSKTSLPNLLRFFSTEKPTSPHFDRLVNEAGQSRDFPTIHSLLTQRVQAGCFNTTNTFSFVTHADPTTLLPHLIPAISSLDEGFSRKNAFDSLIARLSKSHPDHALHVLDEMLQRRIGANAVTFYPLLSHLSRNKWMDRVSDLLELMRREGIPPDTTCYNYVLSALCHLGDLPAAATALNSMLQEGLVADSMTFDALVLGACRAGRFDGAVALVRRMEEEGVHGMYSTYAHIIRGLLHVGGHGEAIEFVRCVGGTCGRERRLDGENYGVLGRGLLRRERWEEVTIVVREMQDKGLEVEDKLMDAYIMHTE